ncbi:hypothetical protein mRhiFer1_009218 [Rhinolophus ferrumequinum]|uniref:Uncharacterized protein n=1 Tax=Rhinolophus ferrumequinum TaxID=59479 RepID=A0A7J7S8B2_RHIFE|nr:hypothetical protein mRhiFer1_009218 [Rhinolophus ferrumequinum]
MRSAQPRGRNAELGRLLAAALARGPRSFSIPRRLVCQTRGTRAGLHFPLARVAALRPIRLFVNNDAREEERKLEPLKPAEKPDEAPSIPQALSARSSSEPTSSPPPPPPGTKVELGKEQRQFPNGSDFQYRGVSERPLSSELQNPGYFRKSVR